MTRLLAFILIPLFLAGCGTTAYRAPVREIARPAKPAVAAKPPPVRPGYYRVLAGDTLYKIAFENGLDYQALAAWNALADPNLIRAGEELRLTAPPGALRTSALPTQPVFTLPAPAASRPEPAQAAAAVSASPAPSLPSPPALPADADDPPSRWIWPAKGEVVTRFDGAVGSKGIDIANRRGTPVLAAAPGRVVYVGSGLRGYGKLLIIKHSKTFLSAYGHHDEMFVAEGQTVSQGQVIGRMGDTDAEQVKLHFEIREHGKPVDPINYLPKIGGERWGVE